MNPNDQIKDWRGRDFRVKSVEPVTGDRARSMIARGWEPCILFIEWADRVRTAYMAIADGSVHEVVDIDRTYPGRFA
jgi:hypothetical protein